jgi:hypothetical protein
MHTRSGQETHWTGSLSGQDVFISAPPVRRALVPASLRRGRHRSTRTRTEVADQGGEDSRSLHLVDVDGRAETTRIELRRRFEAGVGEGCPAERQDSVAG